MLVAVLLLVFGVVMLLRPHFIWQVTEQWKSNDATEPSPLYIASTRFGGFMCLCVGLASLYVALLAT